MRKFITSFAGFVILVCAFQITGEAKEGGHLFPILQDGKWGYMDETGKAVIEPRFRMAFDFSEGLAGVVLGNKFGFVNEFGELIVEPKYDEAGSFSEGRAVVSKDYRWAYIDRTGKYVWRPAR